MRTCETDHIWIVQTTNKGKVYLWCKQCAYRFYVGQRFTWYQRVARTFFKKPE